MAFGNSMSVRSLDDLESAKYGDAMVKVKYKNEGSRFERKNGKSSIKAKVLSRVFSEDYERVKKKILDPRGPTIRIWNKIFLVACLLSLFVDPLFFYLPVVGENFCIDIEIKLEVALTIIRSIADIFYIIQIYVRFRTAYIAPSSRVFGRGELVIDSSKIALRYLCSGFWIDAIAALPLPQASCCHLSQHNVFVFGFVHFLANARKKSDTFLFVWMELQVLIWVIIPMLRGSMMANTKNVLRSFIIFQYLPRLYLIFPLSSQIVKATGVVTETAWAGAAYNLMLYMLASHILGAFWYLLSIERQEGCWHDICILETPSCKYDYFDCNKVNNQRRNSWFMSSNITQQCSSSESDNTGYPFGIYGDALTDSVTSAKFFNKYFYCLWWGLKNLSSLGQNLATSTSVGEILFAIIIATLGLVLFGLLIGNMQTYLQSTTVRLEEWRTRRTDTERWMHHRQLPLELRQAVRKYDQYKWLATRGVDEDSLLKGLPLDLRRDIKRHLCYDLVRRVPLFDEMDGRMMDAICERLNPVLCTQDTCLMREGDPVNEMLFIIRGNLDSYTTNGGRTGFFNSCSIGPGDFCGEELLTWALDPRPSVILPSSTRTVRAVSEVEAFALAADDLKFVAGQFRRLHSKQLRHKFRFYSHQWRMWAATFIQAAWRRHKKRKMAAEIRAFLQEEEGEEEGGDGGEKGEDEEENVRNPGFGVAVHAARLAAAAASRRSQHRHKDSAGSARTVATLQKPAEPDFSLDFV